MIPVAFPTFYQRFGADVQTIVGSGITMGSLSAIVLNLAFNVLQRKPKTVVVEPLDRLSIDEVNALDDEEFAHTFAPLFQGEHGIAAAVASQRPFDSLYELRRAFHDALFDADDDAQRALIGAYPDIAAKVALGQESRRDQSHAGLDRLDPLEYERFDELNDAYRAKFGHPFLICVRENTKESILDSFERRLQNTPRQEQMAALVEIGKIANLRLLDLVEDERSRESAKVRRRGAEAGVRGRRSTGSSSTRRGSRARSTARTWATRWRRRSAARRASGGWSSCGRTRSCPRASR